MILRHVRLDLGQFPHLMPPGLRVAAREFRAATPALGRLDDLNVVALAARQQWPLMLLMARLSAAPLLRLRLAHRRLGVRMLARWRQRRVLGGHAEPRFQIGHASQQPLNKRPYRRRHLSFYFGRNGKAACIIHAPCVAEIARCAKTSLSPQAVNGCVATANGLKVRDTAGADPPQTLRMRWGTPAFFSAVSKRDKTSSAARTRVCGRFDGVTVSKGGPPKII